LRISCSKNNMLKVEAITSLINKHTICTEETFSGYASLIDRRYLSDFEDAWMKCYEDASLVKLSARIAQHIDVLRETAFKAAYRATRDPDLAALVSDDFELIGIAAASELSFPWINGLWIAYLNGIFPTDAIQPKEGILASLIP
jgi:hypothetical protein